MQISSPWYRFESPVVVARLLQLLGSIHWPIGVAAKERRVKFRFDTTHLRSLKRPRYNHGLTLIRLWINHIRLPSEMLELTIVLRFDYCLTMENLSLGVD